MFNLRPVSRGMRFKLYQVYSEKYFQSFFLKRISKWNIGLKSHIVNITYSLIKISTCVRTFPKTLLIRNYETRRFNSQLLGILVIMKRNHIFITHLGVTYLTVLAE